MAEEKTEARRAQVHGEYRFKLDAKGRVSMPAQFRKLFSDNLVVTLAPTEKCLYVFEPDGFDAWVAEAFKRATGEEYNNTDPVQRGQHRLLYRRAHDLQPDTAGRIMLPADQREAAEIGREAVILGNGDHFEIWAAESFDAPAQDVDLKSLFG